MGKPIRVLCVHGVGGHQADTSWQQGWTKAIQAGFAEAAPGTEVVPSFVLYDDLFAAYPITLVGMAEALIKLGISGVGHGIGDLFRALVWMRGIAPAFPGIPGVRGMPKLNPSRLTSTQPLRSELNDPSTALEGAVTDHRGEPVCSRVGRHAVR
jgi:hypothetical protein